MEIQTSSAVYVWLIEGIFLLWLALLVLTKKQHKLMLGKLMLIFFGLSGVGALFWSIPILFTHQSNILTVTAILGDILFLIGLSFSWIITWYVFFKPRNVNILYFVIPVVMYLTSMIIFTVMVTFAHPPFFRDGQYVYYINQYWNLVYTVAYLPLPFLGVYFLQQARLAKDSIRRFRAATWGIIHIVIGVIGLLGYFINFTTRNTLNIIALASFLVATILYRILLHTNKK